MVCYGNNSHVFRDAACGQDQAAVEKEVAEFFRQHPFLLVSEDRLAVLLCRPRGMVQKAVREMERAGLLRRKDADTVIHVEEGMVKA